MGWSTTRRDPAGPDQRRLQGDLACVSLVCAAAHATVPLLSLTRETYQVTTRRAGCSANATAHAATTASFQLRTAPGPCAC